MISYNASALCRMILLWIFLRAFVWLTNILGCMTVAHTVLAVLDNHVYFYEWFYGAIEKYCVSLRFGLGTEKNSAIVLQGKL